MPRKRKTQPTQGGTYANRTDLTTGTQAVSAPTGLPYGERQALEEAQRQAPVPQAAGPSQIDPAIAMALGHTFNPVGIGGPSARPHEPITHGLPMGSGAGPEVLPTSNTMADQMRRLAMSTGDPAIEEIANRMAQYGI